MRQECESLFQFKRKKQEAVRVQLRETPGHPFGLLSGYEPLREGEARLYRSIREAVPILDAAIGRLVRMSGGVSVRAGDQTGALREFLRTVPTGRGQRGLDAFLETYLDSMLVCGRGVGEIVLSRKRDRVAALLCADPDRVAIREGKDPLDYKICARQVDGTLADAPAQELLLFTPYHAEADHPYGVSMLRSLPFMTDVLMKIYQATGTNWERMGNARFAVVYKPEKGESAWARERGGEIAQAWSQAMSATRDGSVRDFVAVGDVDIKVIGADNPVLDAQVPVRQLLEQIVSVTGIPPFLLGLSWSSTERMSAQQADMLTTEVTALRRLLTPVVERICETWLRVMGYPAHVEVEWDKISLQDLVEEARAGLYLEQAAKLRQEIEEKKTKKEVH